MTMLLFQVMDRTEKLMMKAIIRYREDQDLENAIDFIQKKVNRTYFLLSFSLNSYSGEVPAYLHAYKDVHYQCL